MNQLRNLFPVLKNNPDIVYLDNAATTQKPDVVINSIVKFYEEYNANVHRGIHELSEKATQAYEEARSTVGGFINAAPEEVIFTSGTTDSLNKMVGSIADLFGTRDTILISESEHHSNMLPWQKLAQDKGFKLQYIKLNEKLEIDLDHMESLLKSNNTALISLSHISNVTGAVTNIKQASMLASKYGALIVVDGAQAIAHTPVDVATLGIDFYVFSGHKMYGPTGIGVLWGKKKLLQKMPPIAYGGGMINIVGKESSTWADVPEKHEAGTPNIAGAIGLAEAARFIRSIGWEEIEKHELELSKYALEKLNKIEELVVYGPENAEERSAVITFNIHNIHPHDVAQILADHKVAVRAGHHCCQILHKETLCVPATVRASLAVYNTKEDIDKLSEAIINTINQFK